MGWQRKKLLKQGLPRSAKNQIICHVPIALFLNDCKKARTVATVFCVACPFRTCHGKCCCSLVEQKCGWSEKMHFCMGWLHLTELMSSLPPGREWRYVLSNFRNIIYCANTRKIFGSDEQIANREHSIARKCRTNFSMDGSLQWIPFCKTELWKWKFRILKHPLKKEVSSQNKLGCSSSWFKFVVSGKQKVQLFIDPIV